MRGKTIKNIKKFVDIIISNTPEEQRTKSREKMIEEVKDMWIGNPQAKKFVHKVINRELTNDM